jgi:hypothetical protein
MLAGCVAFSFVAGAMTSMMMTLDEQNSAENRTVQRIRELQERHHFPQDIFRELLKNLGTRRKVKNETWLLE